MKDHSVNWTWTTSRTVRANYLTNSDRPERLVNIKTSTLLSQTSRSWGQSRHSEQASAMISTKMATSTILSLSCKARMFQRLQWTKKMMRTSSAALKLMSLQINSRVHRIRRVAYDSVATSQNKNCAPKETQLMTSSDQQSSEWALMWTRSESQSLMTELLMMRVQQCVSHTESRRKCSRRQNLSKLSPSWMKLKAIILAGLKRRWFVRKSSSAKQTKQCRRQKLRNKPSRLAKGHLDST